MDIDGTLVKHGGDVVHQITGDLTLLDGTLEKMVEWDTKGYHIILVTGRRESARDITVQQLSKLGIFYDQLIMGVSGGTRVLINDRKTDGVEETAVAICVERNLGIRRIDI